MTDEENDNQGEGNREADREYRKNTREFVDQGGVEKNRHKHSDLSPEDKKVVRQSEREAREKATQ